jgi:hypothetical protein
MRRSLDKTTELPPLLSHINMLMADDDEFDRLSREFQREQKRGPRMRRENEVSPEERLEKDRATAKGMFGVLQNMKLRIRDDQTRMSAEKYEVYVADFLKKKNLDWDLNALSGGASDDPMLIE